MKAFALLLAALALAWTVALSARAGPPPSHIVVVTDDRYPPYLFRGDDGELQGPQGRSGTHGRQTGVRVGCAAPAGPSRSRSARAGADVIDLLAYTPARDRDFVFRQTARPWKRASISRSRWAASGVGSLRGLWWAPSRRAPAAAASLHGARNHARTPIRRRWWRSDRRRSARLLHGCAGGDYLLFHQGVAEQFMNLLALLRAHPLGGAPERGLSGFIQRGFDRVPRAQLAHRREVAQGPCRRRSTL